MQKKYDAVQLASIRRSETYLRKKAMQPRTSYTRELLEAIAGVVILASIVVICLAL